MKSQIESLKDENILFGETSKQNNEEKEEIPNAQITQEVTKDEPSAPEHIILSQNTQSIHENSQNVLVNENLRNDEALLFGASQEKEDTPMKNENKENYVQEKENTVSDNQSIQEDKIQAKINTPEKITSEEKLSDIERQIQEIQKAIDM